MQTLSEHGIDAQRGQSIQVSDPAAIQAVFKTLSEHSEDLGHMQQQRKILGE